MIEVGDIHLADLNEEVRRRVLVLSNPRFNEMSGRVIIAPQIFGEPDDVPFPWRVRVDDDVYAVDLLRSLSTVRLLDRIDRAPTAAVTIARRALLQIT